MKKLKYMYHPNDDESDYRIGVSYRGRVRRSILTRRNHPRAIEVEFPNGKVTTVHRKSFEVSDTSISFYPKGASITIKKVGYTEDRRITKWVIINPLKYDLYSKEGIINLLEEKQAKLGATKKYDLIMPPSSKKSPSIAARFINAIHNIFAR